MNLLKLMKFWRGQRVCLLLAQVVHLFGCLWQVGIYVSPRKACPFDFGTLSSGSILVRTTGRSLAASRAIRNRCQMMTTLFHLVVLLHGGGTDHRRLLLILFNDMKTATLFNHLFHLLIQRASTVVCGTAADGITPLVVMTL